LGLLDSLFQFRTKSLTTSLFSVVFPQAPAGLQNREYLKAYKGWVFACVRVIANDVDSDGKLKVIPKDLIKEALGRSPDFADMIAMRMWFDLDKTPVPDIR
jgi:hypothetical protein